MAPITPARAALELARAEERVARLLKKAKATKPTQEHRELWQASRSLLFWERWCRYFKRAEMMEEAR